MRSKKGFMAVFITAMSAIVFFSGCGMLPKEEEVLAPPLTQPKKQEYQVYDVKRTDIVKSVNGNGNFISTNESDIFAKENGKRVKKVNVKYGQAVKKGDVLIELDSGNLENDVKLERLNLQKVQINYDKAFQTGDDYAKKLADIDLQMEKLKLQQMESQLDGAKLTASESGKVIFVDSVKEGDTLEAYKPVVTIADPGSLQVLYQPSAAAGTKVGQKVQLKYNGKNFDGIVSQMPDSGKYKNFILIAPSGKIEGAQIDESVEISIIIETKKDALIVPKAVVKSFSGTKTVEVLEGDKKISTDVETGIETSTDIEILSGLTEGQKVILR